MTTLISLFSASQFLLIHGIFIYSQNNFILFIPLILSKFSLTSTTLKFLSVKLN